MSSPPGLTRRSPGSAPAASACVDLGIEMTYPAGWRIRSSSFHRRRSRTKARHASRAQWLRRSCRASSFRSGSRTRRRVHIRVHEVPLVGFGSIIDDSMMFLLDRRRWARGCSSAVVARLLARALVLRRGAIAAAATSTSAAACRRHAERPRARAAAAAQPAEYRAGVVACGPRSAWLSAELAHFFSSANDAGDAARGRPPRAASPSASRRTPRRGDWDARSWRRLVPRAALLREESDR